MRKKKVRVTKDVESYRASDVHLRNDFESFGKATNQKRRKLFAFFVVSLISLFSSLFISFSMSKMPHASHRTSYNITSMAYLISNDGMYI